MILPFVKMGSLRDLMMDSNDTVFGPYLPRIVSPHLMGFATPVSQHVDWQIVGIGHGVAYLHSQNPPVIHGDLHPVSFLNLNHGVNKLRPKGRVTF